MLIISLYINKENVLCFLNAIYDWRKFCLVIWGFIPLGFNCSNLTFFFQIERWCPLLPGKNESLKNRKDPVKVC